MVNIYNKIYFKFRKREVCKAKIIMKKLDLDNIDKGISKICWNSGIEYEAILKKPETLLLLLRGKKDVLLLKFVKKDMIFLEEFESYLDDLYKYDVTKGVYITTGVFEQRIRDKCSFIPMYKKIKLVDKYNFIKDQLGVNGKALEVFKENRFKLYKYLPN